MSIDRLESSHDSELEQELEDFRLFETIMQSEHERIHELHEDLFDTTETLRRRYDL